MNSFTISKNIGRVLYQQRKLSDQFKDRKDLCDAAGVSERTLAKIESGDSSVSLSRYLSVAELLGVDWFFEVFQKVSQDEPRLRYLTALTSLNLPLESRETPLWHTTYANNVRSWSISGVNFTSTSWLLGVEGLVRANDALDTLGFTFDFDVYAASYERATFDLLYEFFVVREEPVPNVQATDIDDSVNFQKVIDWIDRSVLFVDRDKIRKMKLWLENSDYEFNGNAKAA